MRWLIVLPFDRPGHMGVDFADELTALGHEVRTFAYRRENLLYKNHGSKAPTSAGSPAGSSVSASRGGPRSPSSSRADRSAPTSSGASGRGSTRES